MKVAILKYNAGNVKSVLYALKRLNVSAIITDNASEIQNADKVIIPGVGEASSAMSYLKEKKIDEVILNLKQPVLGVCLGMQLLCNHSEENNTECLGLFDTSVIKFQGNYNVPHVGWNEVNEKSKDYYAYFLHSYYVQLCKETTAISKYNLLFSAALKKNNFYGVQFHPEKSSIAGETIIKQFLSL